MIESLSDRDVRLAAESRAYGERMCRLHQPRCEICGEPSGGECCEPEPVGPNDCALDLCPEPFEVDEVCEDAWLWSDNREELVS